MEERIVELLEYIVEHGITVHVNLLDNDKYSTDLAAMRIGDGLASIAEAIDAQTIQNTARSLKDVTADLKRVDADKIDDLMKKWGFQK